MGWIILINNLRRIMKTNKTIMIMLMLMLIGTKSTTNNNDHQLINYQKVAQRNSLVFIIKNKILF